MIRKYFLPVLCCLPTLSYALSITGVSHSPKYIDIKKNQSVTIRYAIDEDAAVTLNIFDDRDLLVRKIASDNVLKSGANKFVWDGRDQTNRPVPAEAYRYTLIANNGKENIEYDLSDFTGGVTDSVENVSWDKDSQLLHYSILRPSRISIRVGFKNNGPLMATLLDWQPKEHGQHTVRWNGLDNSGAVDLAKIGNYEIYAQGFTLSDNTIQVGPETNKSLYVQDPPWPEEKRVRKKNISKHMKVHSQQYAEKRGDFVIEITLPKDLDKTKNGLPIIKSITPVKFKLSFEDQRRITNDRYEPILFVDGQFQTENEVGFFPMTWNWDPKDLAEGEHYLTVNLRGYEGHFGAASAKVYVKH